MDATQYIFLNKGARMSPGKIAAQAGHAAVESLLISGGPAHAEGDLSAPIIKEWRKGGHYKKIVLEARDGEHLMVIDRYLRDRNIRTALIIDEGHTEVPPLTPTALGVEILDKDREDVQAIFSSFDLYRAPRPPKPDEDKPPYLRADRPMVPPSEQWINTITNAMNQGNQGSLKPIIDALFKKPS